MFWPGFWKKDLQIGTPHSPLDPFSWKFAQRYFSRVQKIWWERNFEFFIYLLFIAQKPVKMAIFVGFWTTNSEKMKNSKFRSHQIFCTLEKYLCANFQLKQSNGEWGVAIWRFFLLTLWLKHCIFKTFFTPTADLQMSIKSEPTRVRRQMSTFWNKER